MTSLPEDLDRLLHDLRGPLNAIQMHVELLKRLTVRDPAGLSSVEIIGQEVIRLARLLPAAFQVVALEPGERTDHDLGTLVREALTEHSLAGVAVVEQSWPRVRGDSRLLRLAIAHLARHALGATPQGGPVPTVSARESGTNADALVVRDWGPGLKTTNPRALIRLTMHEGSRPDVGLVTVERVARLHGGRLEFDNASGGGAEVRLVLPRA